MRRRAARLSTLPLVAALLAVSAAPASAQGWTPDEPGQGQAIGNAGTALAMLRLLPRSVPADSIMPEFEKELPEASAFEGAFGLAGAEANSAALLTYERAIATAAPFAGSLLGTAPAEGSLVQTALPDNAKPRTGSFRSPESPLSGLVRVANMNGSAHARWSPSSGPCVGTIADATAQTANLAIGNAVPTVPDWAFSDLPLPLAKGFVPEGRLGSLGGLLSGARQSGNGDGTLVSSRSPLSARSTVDLAGKAVRSTSTLRARTLELFQGSPQAVRIRVARPPTLRVTSSGSEKTSRVDYTPPTLEASHGTKRLFALNAARPSQDIPIGIPIKGFEAVPGSKSLRPGLVVAGYALTRKGTAARLSEQHLKRVRDLFVLRLSIAGLDQQGRNLTSPYRGHQLGASARLLDVQLLPTEALADAVGERGEDLPSSLVQISVGEQVARASAPAGGVVCGSTAAPPASSPAAGIPERLLPVSLADKSVPMFWTGAGALLLGVILVSVFPRRRPPTVVKPSPRPRT